MKTTLIIGLMFLSLNLFGQEYYYWNRGQKIPLKIEKQKKYVVYTDNSANQATTYLQKNSWKILKKAKEKTFNTINRFQKLGNRETQNWAVIENSKGALPDSLSHQLPAFIRYMSPFFISKEGKEIGLSDLFYVKLKNAADIKTLENFAAKNNVEILGNNKFMPLWYTLSCTKSSKGNALKMANTFYESGNFSSAQPDFLLKDLSQCVNDTYYSYQWNLNNSGQNGGTNGVDIQYCETVGLTLGCNDITVAVIDEGIELNHPDLLNMSSSSYDIESATSPSQVRGSHGTCCGGIIGAATNNSLGVAGIAPECQLMSVSDSLVLEPNESQELANGINWAWQHGADVLSNSWGHNNLAGDFIDDAISNALTYGRSGLGCVVVFATGNDNSSVIYPANSNSDIIAVGAMSPCGERKNPNSCDGEDWWGSNYGTQLDLVAPGVFIPTTDRQGSAGYNTNSGLGGNYFMTFNGTSSATPQVAAVAALVLSINPNLTQDQVRNIIESTCTKVGSYTYSTVTGRTNGTWNNQVGYGCVNAFAAVQKAFGGPISGGSLVCSSGSSFSISNLPSGAAITWSQSGNISRTSSQGSNPCTFKAIGSGSGWIGATITTSCGGSFSLPRKIIYAGSPLPLDIRIVDGTTGMPKYVFCLSQHNGVHAEYANTYAQVDLWDWDVTGGVITYDNPYGGDKSVVTIYPNNPSSFNVKLNAHNSCGWSGWTDMGVGTMSCGTYSLALTPNPATTETTISIESDSGEELSATDQTSWDLEVYNVGHQLKMKKVKIKGRSTTINTSGLKEGVYIVRVQYKDSLLTEKMIVKK